MEALAFVLREGPLPCGRWSGVRQKSQSTFSGAQGHLCGKRQRLKIMSKFQHLSLSEDKVNISIYIAFIYSVFICEDFISSPSPCNPYWYILGLSFSQNMDNVNSLQSSIHSWSNNTVYFWVKAIFHKARPQSWPLPTHASHVLWPGLLCWVIFKWCIINSNTSY